MWEVGGGEERVGERKEEEERGWRRRECVRERGRKGRETEGERKGTEVERGRGPRETRGERKGEGGT